MALVSDAGTPLVADPGYRLAVEAIAAGHAVTAVPGRLGAARGAGGGGAADRPLPLRGLSAAARRRPAPGARRARGGAGDAGLLRIAAAARGEPRRHGRGARRARPAAVCRELTKRFEEARRGAARRARRRTTPPRRAEGRDRGGGRAAAPAPRRPPAALDAALAAALDAASVKDAAAEVAAALGLPRRAGLRPGAGAGAGALTNWWREFLRAEGGIGDGMRCQLRIPRVAHHSGLAAEEAAARGYLADGGRVSRRRAGAARRARSTSSSRMPGEIVFVEVKARRRHAADAVTARQWARIGAAASRYLAEVTDGTMPCRFDLALVDRNGPASSASRTPASFDGW